MFDVISDVLNDIMMVVSTVNKQINDKERVAAAMENPNLREIVEQCVAEPDDWWMCVWEHSTPLQVSVAKVMPGCRSFL